MPVRLTEEADHEQHLRDLQREEHHENGTIDSSAPQEHVEVEDRKRHQEPRERVRDVGRTESRADLRGAEEHDENPEPEPESPVGRERGRAEDVPIPELPHPGEELRHAAVEERRPDPDEVRDERGVVSAQQERRQRETGESERSGISDGSCVEGRRDLPFLDYSHDSLPCRAAPPRRRGDLKNPGL